MLRINYYYVHVTMYVINIKYSSVRWHLIYYEFIVDLTAKYDIIINIGIKNLGEVYTLIINDY